MKIKWLTRYGCPPMPFLCLVMTPDELAAVERKLGTCGALFPASGAHTLTYDRKDGRGITCVVALAETLAKRDLIQIQALLVHEAVHIWQKHAADIGEDFPGAEQEAYAIQYLSEALLREFDRRVKGGVP